MTVTFYILSGTPKGYLSHNCPTSVSEYGNLQCACSVTDRGSPQGEIRWQKSSTNELSLNGVLRAQNGNILTCVLTWNRTEIQFLHYTIIVTCESSTGRNATLDTVTNYFTLPLVLSFSGSLGMQIKNEHP